MVRSAFESDSTWRRWSLAGVGPVLFVCILAISTGGPVSLLTEPVVFAYPIVLALGVTGAGLAAVRQELSPEEIWGLTRWTALITVLFAGLSLWGVFLVFRGGGSITIAESIATSAIATGAGVGVVLGEYERQRRQESAKSEFVKAAVENAMDGVAILNADEKYIMVNQAHAELYGYADAEAMVGETWRTCYEPEHIDRFEEEIMPALYDVGVWRGEVEGLRADGVTFPQELSLTTLDDGGLICVVRDITERTEYERRLNALHETTRELMSATTKETVATRASEAATDILNLSLNGIHLYDNAEDGLVPITWTSETEAIAGEPPTFSSGDSEAWQTFERGEVRVFNDVSDADDVYSPDTQIKSELHLPLGDHGVFLVGETTPEAFKQSDVALAKLLATNVEAAFDRADREQSLRDRETQLARERDRFATLFENIPDPAVIVDFNGGESVIQSVNQAFLDVFGYTEAEAVGTFVNDLIVPAEFTEEATRLDERGVANEQIIQEVRRQNASGEIRDFLFRNVPIGSETGEVYGIYTDITERKRRERTLEALNEVTKSQIQASSATEICELAVAAGRDVLDLPLAGIHLFDETKQALVPTAVPPEVTECLDESILTFDVSDVPIWEAFDAEEVRIIQDIQYIPDEQLPDQDTPIQSAVVLPIGGHGVFIISAREPYAFNEDEIHLTELLAATTAIALDRSDQDRKLKRLHEATRELMSASNEQSIANLTLEAASDILGFPMASVRYLDADTNALVPVSITDQGREILGEPEVFHEGESLAWKPLETGEPRTIEDVTEYDASVNAGTGVRSLLILPLGEYGTLNIASLTVDAFDEMDRSLAQVLAANVEAALDRAADERELMERGRELRQQNEHLEHVADVLSHDLRNPLTVAKGRLELLDVDGSTEHLDPIRRAHNRMEALIDDVLTLARQGRAVGETTVVPVDRMVTRAWAQVETDSARIDADIDLNIEADESRLQQLFENLFRNAIEHGGDDVTVRVGTLADGTGFYVEDDGPGISPDERDAVFEHGYSTAVRGTGFGLAIVQQIVLAHRWTISVAESVDGGARFEIRGITPVSDRND